MPLERVHSFLVHPAKHADDQPDIGGTPVPSNGPLYDMLSRVYERAPNECTIDIVFRPTAGRQQNDCRDLVVAYLRDATTPHGRQLARRLQSVTTNRSGLGLLFLMRGREGREHTLVISRFPADEGIIAREQAREQLSLQFVEEVFLKNAQSYKSAFYASESIDRGFWDGRAVDRQVSGPRELSEYWIRDFLSSELRTTAAAGSKRVAEALRAAVIASEDVDVRHELISAAALLRGQHGRRRSARQLVEQLGLSEQAATAIEDAFPRPDLMDETFQFDREEFQRHAPYRAVELDNGGLMIADDDQFDQVFRREAAREGRVRYVTEGRVVNEKLRKTK